MRIKAVLLSTIFVFITAGCATYASGMAAGACAAALLGIVTDPNFQVVDVIPDSGAADAGVQVGDQLLDLEWGKMEYAWECRDVVPVDAFGSPLFVFRPVQPIIEPPHPTGPVLFGDQGGIRDLTQYGAVLKLRVQRGDQEIELLIRPGSPGRLLDPNQGTPTPIPLDYLYF